ncbi:MULTISPECIES: IclR family transcriptional regulator C-terminal domain-containing protein [unclassified Pigmentiphaga]|uniref:IclR family transcriptional regulator domain-containing protein n=1 Tax=unclassified Pigmentiphaga TaxID=2626614 RepID=UPI000B4224BB|nr:MULTISPECIES: IclR family transcriptional regulator C-terminal domain-containing protein [unclassified Pigmentiphaga]OVZ65024.1 IclR family transcriptional regulator [Pigmentiphaga sp. NML030171]
MTQSEEKEKKEEFLDGLANGLQVLQIYAGGVPSLTMQDVAERLGVTRAAARRILLTLEKLGYVGQEGRQFSVTPKVLELGYAYFAAMKLPQLARAAMREVADVLGETCSLGVLDREDVVFLAREDAPKPFRLDLSVGSRLPAYPHSLGRVLLSGLEDDALEKYLQTVEPKRLTSTTTVSKAALRKLVRQVRGDGYCISISELVDGFAGVAVPLRGSDGRTVAGLSVSMVLGSRKASELKSACLPVLLKAAERIQSMMPR